MEHIKNGINPSAHRAKENHVYIPFSTDAQKEIQWQEYLSFVAQNKIGDPIGTEAFSVEELKGMNIIGIYKK